MTTNRYFNNTTTLLPASRARANDVETKFSLVDAGFDIVQTEMDLKAPLSSATLTGTPTAPTAAPGTNTTQIATTAFVATSFAPIASPTFTGVPAAPTAAPGTSTTQVATTAFVATSYAPLASPALSGVPTAPTAAPGTSTTQLATTAFATTALNLKADINSPTFTGTVTIPSGANIAGFAPLASPAFTGTPTAPTATAGANTTQIATTAFVFSAVQAICPTNYPTQTGNTGRFLMTNGSTVSWGDAAPTALNALCDKTVTQAGSGASIATSTLAAVELSTGVDLVLFGASNAGVGLQAVVHDEATDTFGAVTIVLAQAVSFAPTVFRLDASRVLVGIVASGGTSVYLLVLSVSGTTITAGSAQLVSIAAANGSSGTQVGSSFVFVFGATAVAATVSGTTVTVGSTVTLGGSANSPPVGLYAHDSSTAIVVSHASTSSLVGNLLTVSGTTLTVGTHGTTTTTVNSKTRVAPVSFDNGKRLVAFENSSLSYSLLSVSGTTVTFSSQHATGTAVNVAPIIKVLGDRAITAWSLSATVAQYNVVTESAGAPTSTGSRSVTITSSSLNALSHDSTSLTVVASGSSAAFLHKLTTTGTAVDIEYLGGASVSTLAPIAGAAAWAPHALNDTIHNLCLEGPQTSVQIPHNLNGPFMPVLRRATGRGELLLAPFNTTGGGFGSFKHTAGKAWVINAGQTGQPNSQLRLLKFAAR